MGNEVLDQSASEKYLKIITNYISSYESAVWYFLKTEHFPKHMLKRCRVGRIYTSSLSDCKWHNLMR